MKNRYKEKTAFLSTIAEHLPSLGQHLAVGAGLHVAANAAIKKLRSSNFGARLGKKVSDIGARHAVEGRQVHPWFLDRVSQTLGPELVSDYNAARTMSKSFGARAKGTLSAMPDPIRDRLDKLPFQKLRKIPMVGAPLASALERSSVKAPSSAKSWADKLTIKDSTLESMSPAKQKLLGYARKGSDALQAAGGFAAGIPGIGDHFAVNAIRSNLSRTAQGKEYVKRRFMKGMNNIPEGKVKRWLGDYMVSPMAHGEAYDLGRQAARFKSKFN